MCQFLSHFQFLIIHPASICTVAGSIWDIPMLMPSYHIPGSIGSIRKQPINQNGLHQNGPYLFSMSKTAHGKVQNGPQLHPKWPTKMAPKSSRYWTKGQNGPSNVLQILWAISDQKMGCFGHPCRPFSTWTMGRFDSWAILVISPRIYSSDVHYYIPYYVEIATVSMMNNDNNYNHLMTKLVNSQLLHLDQWLTDRLTPEREDFDVADDVGVVARRSSFKRLSKCRDSLLPASLCGDVGMP